MSDNLFKIENPEQEGYTVREENGIKYIEKKEIINHETHGECFSFFQQQIQIDENNNTIIKQRNELHKNNQESTIIESNVVTFENEEFKDKVKEDYINGSLIKKFELIKEKVIEHKDSEYPLELIYTKKINGNYNKHIILENDISKIENIFNELGNLIEKSTTDKKSGIITKEFKNLFGNKIIIEEDKNITTGKYYDKSGNIYSIKKIEENKETGITKTSEYDKLDNITYNTSIIEENKNTGITKTTIYDESDNITYIAEENKNTGITNSTSYDKSGNISSITEKNKNTGITNSTNYDKSGNIYSITEENENTGIKKTAYYKNNGSLDYSKIEYKKTDEVEYSVTTGNKEIIYSPIPSEKYTVFKYLYENEMDKLIVQRTIEDLKDGGKKIKKNNEERYIYPECTQILQYREDGEKTKFQSITKNQREILLRKYDIDGSTITSTIRRTKNMPVEIEETFEKGKLFPKFKIDDMEIPLVSLDKYKEVCQKYNIEPLPEVLAQHEPPKPPVKAIQSEYELPKTTRKI